MFNKHAEFDLLVLGATGFTGKLITRYLYAHPARLSGQFTFAVAGRSPSKLKELCSSLSLDSSVPVITIDVSHSASIDAAIRKSKVVINTVGPFYTWSVPIVQSCVKHGVHYLDLNGETHFVLDIINKFHYFATKSKSIIIPSAGFDSLPSDFSVYLANKTLKALTPPNQPFLTMASSVSAFTVKGGISGGTFNTMVTFFESVPARIARQARQPWSISPVRGLSFPGPRLAYTLPYSSPSVVGGFWAMSSTNTAIVQRTCGLQQAELLRLRANSSTSSQELSDQERLTVGPLFTYEEFHVMKSKVQGAAYTVSLVVFGLAMMIAPIRWFLKKLLPKPGTGPSEKVMQNGSFEVRNVSTSAPTASTPAIAVETIIRAKGDPGYLATAVMISESALSILLSMKELPALGQLGGVLTPVSALGEVVINRLEVSGRFQFESAPLRKTGETRKTV